MATVKIHHDDGSTDTIDETLGWSDQREIGKTRRLRIAVERGDAQAVALDPKNDELELVGVFTGRLWDVETGGSSWILTAYSFEHDAKFESPTAGGVLKSGTDHDLITDFIGQVSTWTEGTVATLTGSMDFVLNHAFPHEALRRIEKNVPGELRYNADKSVDYVENLGTDKTGSVTLSAANGNIEDSIRITNRGRELDGTHIRVIGAHEGEAQLFANLVPDDDPATYPNRVNYSTSRWSPGDRRSWDRWANKDVSSQAAIDEEAAALGEEITESLIEARATVPNTVGLEVGDWITVSKPDADLSRSMRVHKITTKAGGMNNTDSGAAVIDDVLLSTRTVMRQGDSDVYADVQRYNVAFQGSAVWGTLSSGRQPVNASLNYELPFFYPDVNFEHRAQLQVRGLPYRAYSSGVAAGGDHSHTVNVTHPSHDHSISTTSAAGAGNSDNVNPIDQAQNLSNGETFTDTFTLPLITGDAAYATVYFTVQLEVDSNSSGDVGGGDVRIRNTSTGTTLQPFDGFATSYERGEFRLYQVSQTGDVEGDNIEVRFDCEAGSNLNYRFSYGGIIFSEHTHGVSDTSTTALGTTQSETSDASGDHTHAVDPGIIEFPGRTPFNVDVIVNGGAVESDIGSGTFETTVDLSGDLNRGQWNMIELSSDTLGHLQAVISIESYRQLGASA